MTPWVGSQTGPATDIVLCAAGLVCVRVSRISSKKVRDRCCLAELPLAFSATEPSVLLPGPVFVGVLWLWRGWWSEKVGSVKPQLHIDGYVVGGPLLPV